MAYGRGLRRPYKLRLRLKGRDDNRDGTGRTLRVTSYRDQQAWLHDRDQYAALPDVWEVEAWRED